MFQDFSWQSCKILELLSKIDSAITQDPHVAPFYLHRGDFICYPKPESRYFFS